jgi:hypothetical protein
VQGTIASGASEVVRKRIADDIITKRTNIDKDKALLLSNQMSTNELEDVFNSRVTKLLTAVERDRFR